MAESESEQSWGPDRHVGGPPNEPSTDFSSRFGKARSAAHVDTAGRRAGIFFPEEIQSKQLLDAFSEERTMTESEQSWGPDRHAGGPPNEPSTDFSSPCRYSGTKGVDVFELHGGHPLP